MIRWLWKVQDYYQSQIGLNMGTTHCRRKLCRNTTRHGFASSSLEQHKPFCVTSPWISWTVAFVCNNRLFTYYMLPLAVSSSLAVSIKIDFTICTLLHLSIVLWSPFSCPWTFTMAIAFGSAFMVACLFSGGTSDCLHSSGCHLHIQL